MPVYWIVGHGAAINIQVTTIALNATIEIIIGGETSEEEVVRDGELARNNLLSL